MTDSSMPMVEGESRIRPLVAKRSSNRAIWAFVACAGLGGTALFASLESRRTAITAPAIAPGTDDDGFVGSAGSSATGASAIPPIVIPPDAATSTQPAAFAQSVPPQASMVPAGIHGSRYEVPIRLSAAPPAAGNFAPPAITTPSPSLPTAVSTPSGPEVVYEANRSKPAVNVGLADEGEGNNGKGTAERVRAGHFANPATTVPKGTVIQAVLESALDSTRAGLARAIISRDIVGFDGSKVLIARGSRLIGEYKADLTSGQSRAMIQWQRLMRPDGVIINLDSPSADPLGRAGVKGKVNGHFLAQYGGAILQSALNVGEQVAANKLAGSTAIYALPGIYATPTITNPTTTTGNKTQPTLTVKQGTSISVFVAHDLDFTGVE